MPVNSGRNIRKKIPVRERGPGPERYELPSTLGYQAHDCTRPKQPAYTIGKRLERAQTTNPGPYYVDPRMTRTGMHAAPEYTMVARKDINIPKTPGPGHYTCNTENIEPQAPQYTIRTRTKLRRKDPILAPATYTLPPILGNKQFHKSTAPVCVIVDRPKVGGYLVDMGESPGPGKYAATNPNVNTSMAPVYTMRSKCHPPGDSDKPGPGAYSPEKVRYRPQAPKFSFGSRYSESTCVFIA
ncbi:outer dense fiber protein 3-like [Ostrea edulis]|uniref:outer dense fiber protein 3-like n=1 Tax=Ostrea edulis TaxID=37623 RepID=UPI0024AEE4F2|nr:outer dense fiber protein 3-like [Ostrea edulis]